MEVDKPTNSDVSSSPVLPSKPELTVPSSKGHRPWKTQKERPARAMRRTANLKVSLEAKNRRRQEKEALMRIVRAAKEADATMKKNERKRREERRKQKEENELRSTKKLVITDPKKIAKMSKKQYLKYVQQAKK